ncbi:MAG: rRNA pseudouridine synthase [Clostridia bacterium]|nr:rRNA pseudouridine synthase [Clostridia bacterium]
MRIQKYIADAGICSRRKAEEMIVKGLVKVNGETLDELGYQMQENDVVEVDGQVIGAPEKKVYYMMYKPRGYVTTVKDQFDRPCVMDLIGDDIKERIYPAGRLDYHTEGLLILSNDGAFVNAITHPKHHIEKKYLAVINGKISEEDVEKLKRGVVIDGRKTAPAKVFLSEIFKDKCLVEVTISEGRNRQVRKMFEAVGHHVIELKRVQIGPIDLGSLKEGRIRKLNPNEVQALISLAEK